MPTKTKILKTNYAVQTKHEALYTGGCIQWCSSGEWFLSQCFDFLCVVSAENSQCEAKLDSEDDPIIWFVLSPNDLFIITSHKSGLLKQWEVEGKKLIRTWKALHIGFIRRLVFDSTSTLLASGASDSLIKVWDIQKQYCTHCLRGAQGVISVIVFHPESSSCLLFGASDNVIIYGWDLKTSCIVYTLEGHYSIVTALLFSLKNNSLISSGRDKVILVWDLENQVIKKTIAVYESIETLVQYPISDPSKMRGSFVISGGEKGVVKFWDVNKGVHLWEIPEKSVNPLPSIISMSVAANTSLLHVVYADQTLVTYDLKTQAPVKQLLGFSDEILDVCFVGSEEDHIVVATNSSVIKLYSKLKFECKLIHGHSNTVVGVTSWPADLTVFASCSKDTTIRVWKIEFSSDISVWCVGLASGHTGSITSISSNCLELGFLASVSEDTCLKIYEFSEDFLNDCQNLVQLSAKHTTVSHSKTVNCVCISPNDKLVATGSQDNTAKLWTLNGLNLLGTLRGHRRGIWCVQFSVSDSVLATGSGDTTVKIWSIVNFTCLKTLKSHESSVLCLAFISQGLQLLTTSSEGLVKLWNLKTNECTKTWDEHEDKVWALAGAADSKLILWKDITEDEENVRAADHEKFILQEQQLQNLLQARKSDEALKMCLTLKQPFRALGIIKDVLTDKTGDSRLQNLISELEPSHQEMLLNYAVDWNTNSKHCLAALTVVQILLSSMTVEQVLKLPNIQSHIENLLPYTEKHFQRLNHLLQSILFLNLTHQRIRTTADRCN